MISLEIKALIELQSLKNFTTKYFSSHEEENIGIDRKTPRKRYISPEKRQKIIDDLRLIYDIL